LAATVGGTAINSSSTGTSVSASTYKTAIVTASSDSTNHTVVTVTLNTTLATACGACAITKLWISGTNSAANTASNGGVTYSVPTGTVYGNAYFYFPTAGPIGTPYGAGQYLCQMTYSTTGVCFNTVGTWNGTGQPPLIATPTKFSGLSANTYTQTTSSTILLTTAIPANSMGANGCLNAELAFSNNYNSDNKTVAIYWGASGGLISQAVTTIFGDMFTAKICNGGTGVQVGSVQRLVGAASGFFPQHFALDTTSSQSLLFKATIAAATDIAAFEFYSVRVYPN
jgi:hypothetical protein